MNHEISSPFLYLYSQILAADCSHAANEAKLHAKRKSLQLIRPMQLINIIAKKIAHIADLTNAANTQFTSDWFHAANTAN